METTLQIKSVQELRKEQNKKLNQLFNELQVFWAFSEEQFMENKPELKDGDKFISIGAGGYMPKSNIEKLKKGHLEISQWYKNEIKKNKLIDKEIIFEFHNHESFYTNDLSDIYDLFPNVSKDHIFKLFIKEYKKYQ